jgi:hypothetical protein
VAFLQALLKLCRFRNYHPAFKGQVFVDDSTPPHLLVSGPSACANLLLLDTQRPYSL